MAGFERRAGVLLCEGSSLQEAAARFGTPLYVYSKDAIVGAYQAYTRAFSAVPHRICYAVKANGSGALLRVLAGLGAGADIVSGGELAAALRAGFAPEHIVFSGVGKTEAEIRAGIAAGVGEFNAESEEEIQRIGAEAVRTGRRARVTLRVKPDIDARSHPYISTGLRESKFGVEIASAPGILGRARELPGVEVVGLQCHIGSQITDLQPIAEAARALAALSRRLLAEGFALRTLDIGGGLGVDYEGSGAPGPAELAAAVVPLVAELPLTLVVEPGRSLVASAGVLLTRVIQVKLDGAGRFVIVDAGMNDLLRPALYGARHRIEPVELRGAARTRADVVGPLCEAGDFLGRGVELPEMLAGELLAIRDAGAYGFCMSSNYNFRPRAAEVLVRDGRLELIRRRETFEDLLASEVSGP